MLAYVYGVVPISLCRGGGCGVSRGKGRGVRIDFDEDDGPITGEDTKLKTTFSAKRRNRISFIRSSDLVINAVTCTIKNILISFCSGGRLASPQVPEPR